MPLAPSRTALAVAIATLVLAPHAIAQKVNPENPPTFGVAPAPVPPSREDTSGLTADIFYRVILGDVALQRGETSLAARAYYEAARDARDARLARRAAEVALAARMRGLAQEAAKLWASLDPAAERPKQIMAALAAGTAGKADAGIDSEIKTRLEKVIADAALTERGPGEIFLSLHRLVGDALDRRQAYELARDLAKPYPKSPEAHFAVALAAYAGGVVPEAAAEKAALEEIEIALSFKPEWERAALFKAELLGKKKPDEAAAFLAHFVAANPDARAAAGALAQLYVEQKKYTEARAVFQRLWDNDRNAREFEFGVAVISVQMKDWETAESLFQDLKKAGFGDNGAVELYLAQIADETGRYAEAIERYKAVPEGDRGWIAKLRVAAMMGKLGKVADGRRYLADLPAVTIEQRIQVRQAESQLLRDANDQAGAYDVLKLALSEHPDNTDLLYDTAMVAEKLDKIDEAEAGLRRVVELKPEDPQALNALGYTLVDRTARIAEGFALIEKAHKLAPDDPFILDSMGWAMFKLGRYADAEAYLRRALKERQDPEIAAHLGEVLWARGEHDRAQEIWQSQLKTSPDNPVLLETVRRLAR
ncbi:MAG: tetratricopeptide repeat protein [Burkholderiales bacterium]|nr:tetratricopeptide repeat protein [Burkholderiales bacterium]